MSDAPAAVPAATPAPAATTTPPPVQSEPKPPAKVEPSAWSEKDDADLIERIKRSPHGKLKVNGKDVAIDSVDTFKSVLLDAQRGRGANRVVEEAKKEASEAKAAKAELERMRETLKRGGSGDMKALRELGLLRDAEQAAQQEEIAKLPPEVRAVVEQNLELTRRLQEREAAEAKTLQERETQAKEKSRADTLAKAKAFLPELMADIREEYQDVDLPDVLYAMESLRAEGLKLGVDYTPEHVKLLVQRNRQQGTESRLGQLKPEVALNRLGASLAKLTPDAARAALGENFAAFAKVILAATRGMKKVEPAPATNGSAQVERPKEEPQPLPRQRFGAWLNK